MMDLAVRTVVMEFYHHIDEQTSLRTTGSVTPEKFVDKEISYITKSLRRQIS